MRLLTTVAQIYRVALLEGGKGDYPPYPYRHRPIPPEVGWALIGGCSGVHWHADRDALNEDGGYIVIHDTADELDLPIFGLPPLYALEALWVIRCSDGSPWWRCLVLANNETAIEHVFAEHIAPTALVAQLKALMKPTPPASSSAP